MNWKWQLAQAAEIRWWEHYLAGRDPEQYLREKRNYWQRVLKAAGLSPEPGMRVLDAGCGPAGIFIALADQRVDAVDPLLDHYAERLPHFRPVAYPYTRFFSQRLEDFQVVTPYPLVFCLNAINHVDDLDRSLDRLASATSRGGLLLLGVDTHRNAWLKHLFRLVPGDVLHPHQHSLDDYLQRLRQRHFRVERTLCLKPGRIFDYQLILARREETKSIKEAGTQ